MRICHACGGEVSDSAEFCRHCSAKQPPAPPRDPNAPVPPPEKPPRVRTRRRASVEPPEPVAAPEPLELDEPAEELDEVEEVLELEPPPPAPRKRAPRPAAAKKPAARRRVPPRPRPEPEPVEEPEPLDEPEVLDLDEEVPPPTRGVRRSRSRRAAPPPPPVEPVGFELPPSEPPPPVTKRTRGNAEAAAFGRIVGLFAVFALGLVAAALLYLQVSGVFDAFDDIPESGDFAEFGAAIVASLFSIAMVLAVLVFGLLSGLILAVIAGWVAARSLPSSAGASGVAALASAVGFVVLVFIVAYGTNAGAHLMAPEPPDIPTPTPFAFPSLPPGEIENCERVFGEGAEECQVPDITALPDLPAIGSLREPAEEVGDWIPLEVVLKACVGAVPTGLVAGLTALVLYGRRRPDLAAPPVAD